MLIKDCISKYVTTMNECGRSSMVQFCFAPKCFFAFTYIAPSGSEYYSHDSFASIREKIKMLELEHQEVCIAGDMTASEIWIKFARPGEGCTSIE